MKQTAVEQFEAHLIEYGFDLSLHKFEIQTFKAVEKEQVIDSYHKGQLSVLDVLEKVLTPMGFDSTSYKEDKEDANEYYKQTFK
jgi:hypothetical protein